MSENLYLGIGFVISFAGLLALPVVAGYQQAKGRAPPNWFFFAVFMFTLFIVPLWGAVIVGAIMMAIGYPIVRLLTYAGKKLAEGKP